MNDGVLDHKVYGHVSKQEFYAMLNCAKRNHVYTDAEGRVDIGGIIAHLVLGFIKGEYKITPKLLPANVPEGEHILVKTEGFLQVACAQSTIVTIDGQC